MERKLFNSNTHFRTKVMSVIILLTMINCSEARRTDFSTQLVIKNTTFGVMKWNVFQQSFMNDGMRKKNLPLFQSSSLILQMI